MDKETKDFLKHLAELKAQEDAARLAGPVAEKKAVADFIKIGGTIAGFVQDFNRDKSATEVGLTLKLEGPVRGWNDGQTAYVIRLLQEGRAASSRVLEISHSSLPIDSAQYAFLRLTAWESNFSIDAIKNHGFHNYPPGRAPKKHANTDYELKQRDTVYEWSEKGKPGKQGLTTAINIIEDAIRTHLLLNMTYQQ